MQRYITENMLPGVSVNPSIAEGLGTELKNNSAIHKFPMRIVSNLGQSHTQPTYKSTLNESELLYNGRRRYDASNHYGPAVCY